jgi:bifunctional non-homologous end joining protein LigD
VSLSKYREKRDFKGTSEPAGDVKAKKAEKQHMIFVIQKHRATQLHYDCRLEFAGVLLSWAVPKGPSLDPSIKRLAMQVEDHPIEYASFEGVIPEGQYGGGTVMVWDRGTWVAESEDIETALKKGDLKFTLQGEKLHGSWVLVRTRGFGSKADKSWLLIKHRDRFASTKDITTKKPRSVVSSRLLAEIARRLGRNLKPNEEPAKGEDHDDDSGAISCRGSGECGGTENLWRRWRLSEQYC